VFDPRCGSDDRGPTGDDALELSSSELGRIVFAIVLGTTFLGVVAGRRCAHYPVAGTGVLESREMADSWDPEIEGGRSSRATPSRCHRLAEALCRPSFL